MSNQWELIPQKIDRDERDAMIAMIDQIDYDFAGRMSMSTRELALYLADARRTIAAAYDAETT